MKEIKVEIVPPTKGEIMRMIERKRREDLIRLQAFIRKQLKRREVKNMRTFWVVSFGLAPEIISVPMPWITRQHLPKSAVGPFWSYREALSMLYFWAK